MHTFSTLPAAEGFRMPAEYEPHRGCVMIWPVRPGSWLYGGRDAQPAFAQAARAIAEAEQIVVHPEEVNAEYHRLAALQETPEAEIRKVLTEDAVAAALAAKKVQRFLLDRAEVTSVTDSAEKE